MVRHWTLTPAFQGSNPCSPVDDERMDVVHSLILFMHLDILDKQKQNRNIRCCEKMLGGNNVRI